MAKSRRKGDIEMRKDVAMETKLEVRVSSAEKDALKRYAASVGKSVS